MQPYEGNTTDGRFNDAIIWAYLTLVETTHRELKVACPMASLRLQERNYPEVLRQLRYTEGRRNAGRFGDHKWLFFVLHIPEIHRGHWVTIGINVQERTYTYYDFAKINCNRDSHMEATHGFLQYLDSLN